MGRARLLVAGTALGALALSATAVAILPVPPKLRFGEDAAIAFSPDGTRVAFAGLGNDDNVDVYVMSLSGRDIVRLTDAPGTDMEPAWSADGGHLAFVSTRDGNQEIYVMAIDGSGQTRITADGGFDDDPSLSGDGSEVAYVSLRDGNPEVYLAPTHGGPARRLTVFAGVDTSPSVSPDGRLVVFQRGPAGSQDIWLVHADGTGLRRLTRASGADVGARFSSSGSSVRYLHVRRRGVVSTYEPWVVPLSGGPARRVRASRV